jgi:ABC-type multidrug transport system fused ATPase/permease subunit
VGKEEQLQWERKWAPAAAVAAGLAALLPLAGSIWTQSLLGSLPSSHSEDPFLHAVHDHGSKFIAAGVLASAGTLFLAPTLAYLYRAIVARRPQIPKIALVLALLAPLISAGAGIARAAVIKQSADQYVSAPLTPTSKEEQAKIESITDPKKRLDEIEKNASDQARKKLTSGSIATVTYVGLVANLLVGVAFVLIAMHAMRAGLLSRFMGILGIIIGALTAVPILGGSPLPLQLFWLVAMSVLFLNRWPQGRGPAWDAVEPIPWPTAQDRRDAMGGGEDQPARPRGGLFQRPAAPADDQDAVPDVEHTREAARPRPSSTHPRSKKRKRKRRG